jgi:hypothetical protein
MFHDKDGIAAVDAAQLLDPEQRKMADGLRTVEPSIKLKTTVSISLHLHFIPPYEEKHSTSNP